uniref:5-azacytidine-induced protein 1 n=1 Tax=Cyprinus carpio TaxID=7962 RepID=A0A8C2GPY0_CYPCA
EDFLALFNSSGDGRRKLASLSKTSKDHTTWNILDDHSRAFPVPSSSHSTCSIDSPTGLKKREAGVSLAANFTANNRSNKAAVGNSVTTILHNNHSEKPLTPKSSNQKPSFNNIIKATVNDDVTVDVSCSLTKSQKNFSSASSISNNNAPRSPGQPRRREVTEEEAERYIQQVNHAAITIQRWYRRHANRKRANENTIKHLLISKKKGCIARWFCMQRISVFSGILSQQTGPDSIRCEDEMNIFADHITSFPQEILQRSVSMEDQRQGASSSRAQSKTTLNDLLDTLKLLEEAPERLSEPKSYRKDKYSFIDEDEDSNSLTTDNVERHRQLSQTPALPDGGALLSEAKLQSIMSFLDEMEKSEQERPRSVTSGSHREVCIYELTAEVTGSMMRLKLELDEKKRTVNMLQTALAQQRELTIRHVKETEKELNHTFQLQKQQYEATIQRHLTFIDQLIDDKKALSERCEEVVGELKQVDQKYTKKIAEMQEQHEMEIKKLKELMSATEKIRREKWIDEKTKKIKEITVKGLEPEIQKLISKHKQELKKLRVLHEAELLQADERAAQRYVRQTEELRQQLERERDEQCQRERELAKQSAQNHLLTEYTSVHQRSNQQHAELEDLRKQLEKNSSLAARALREELEKSREEQERRHQLEIKALKERLEIEKQTWEENYMKKEEAWLLSRERELKEEVRRGRDQEIELAIQRLEEETRGAREECERVADNRIKRVREKYEAELRDLERSERAALQKQQEIREKHSEMEAELLRLQSLLRQREQEISDLTQAHDKLSDERRSLAEVIRQEFAERLVETEEENRRMKMEVSEAKARLRLEVERVTREKEEELAEVHQRSEAAVKRLLGK